MSEDRRPLASVLLPLTSKGYNIADILTNLKGVHESCIKNAGDKARLMVYLGIDIGDPVLDAADNPVEIYFSSEHIRCKTMKFTPAKPAALCRIWVELAHRAYSDGSDYFILLGDDTRILRSDWFDDGIRIFESIHDDLPQLPFGFGSVALLDIGAPGFPTFPVAHRTHMEIFGGSVIPDNFVNQDGDPFLFNLYIPWGAARFAMDVHLKNLIGGVEYEDDLKYVTPRYDRVHIPWKRMLHPAIGAIDQWIESKCANPPSKKILIDIVIPSGRANKDLLQGIFDIAVPTHCITKFIVVIDDPQADVQWLKDEQMKNGRVTMVRNKENIGASGSRNAGINQSSADWILFIDDDVVPSKSILEEYVKAIEAHGDRYDGFLGPTELPPDNRVFSTAFILSGVSFFWTWPRTADEMPWGVTANLLVRNFAKVSEPLLFDMGFIKTGGGEDIHYCLQLETPLKCVPNAVARHPWWRKGQRDYLRTFKWAIGDSLLLDKCTEHTFATLPNVVEVAAALLLSSPFVLYSYGFSTLLSQCLVFPALFLVDTVCEIMKILCSEKEKEKREILINACHGNILLYPLILFEMNVIRLFSETGHLVGPLLRGKFHLCRRFDWFCGTFPGYLTECRSREMLRFPLFALIVLFFYLLPMVI